MILYKIHKIILDVIFIIIHKIIPDMIFTKVDINHLECDFYLT